MKPRTMKLFNATPSLAKLIISTSLAMVSGLLSHNAYALNNILKLDRIVAIVDNHVITEQELDNKVLTVSNRLEKKGTELPPELVLRKQVLERLIIDSIQLQLAEKIGIKVNETQLDKTIALIAKQNQLSLEEFKSALESDGIAYHQFRKDIRGEITISRLKNSEINRRVNVSEGEVDNYLITQENSADKKQEEFELSYILVRTPEESTPEELEKAHLKVEGILSLLNKGEPFEQVSASFSDAPNALEGGNMGWRNSSQTPPAFLKVLKDLTVGEVSKPLRSPRGFYIIKVTNKRNADFTLIVEQTDTRHILIKLNEAVSEQEAKLKMDMLRERLDNGEDFAELARQYSEDGSANDGGKLGWVSPGDTVPEFEKAMNNLAPGQISEPIRSPFGWHIIQVIERRKQDMTAKAARIKARGEIHARKAEEAYGDWLHEIRDSAFIELRLEDTF